MNYLKELGRLTLPHKKKRLDQFIDLKVVKPITITDLARLDGQGHGKYLFNVTVNQTVIVNPPEPSQQPFLRLPKNGERCQVSGLSRSTLSYLIRGKNPKVESIPVTAEDASRGCRLIVTESLISHLNSLREEGDAS